MMDWTSTVCSLLFVVPLMLDVKDSWHWPAGALASLASWVNLLLYLQRYIYTSHPFFKCVCRVAHVGGATVCVFCVCGVLGDLCRFERFGIYVVMFREICKTLLSIILIFVYLILAFALAFYALMIDQVGHSHTRLCLHTPDLHTPGHAFTHPAFTHHLL